MSIKAHQSSAWPSQDNITILRFRVTRYEKAGHCRFTIFRQYYFTCLSSSTERHHNATGILGLGIGGTVYDVVFEYVPGPHTTPETTDVFATPDANLTGAQAAVTAINAALNTSPAITVGPDAYSYIIPYLFNNATCDTLCGKEGLFRFRTAPWMVRPRQILRPIMASLSRVSRLQVRYPCLPRFSCSPPVWRSWGG